MEDLVKPETLEQKVSRLELENTLLREENKELRNEAYLDALTGIMNRRSFDKNISLIFSPKTPEGLEEKRKKEGKENNVCFVMIDIDKFKNINDTYGHPVGDEVLKEVAKRLQGSVRETDIVARYGGEEMVVILREASPYEAGKKVDRLRELIESTPVLTKDDLEIPVTISAGVAFGNNITSDPEILKKQADEAMYKSKHSGRNAVSINDGNGSIRLFSEIGRDEWANFES